MAPDAARQKMSRQQLLQQLQDSNLFFDELVDMIPSKLYVAGQSGDDYNPKYFKGQAKESKEARRAKSKQAKRIKLDPTQAQTTTQIKKRLEGNRPLIPGVTNPETPPSVNTSITITPTNTPSNQSRIEALRTKLREKLAEKRAQRPTDPNVVSKRAARRAEKKKRQEEASQRKKKATSKAETMQNKNFRLNTSSPISKETDLANMDFGRLAGLNNTSNGNYQKANKSLANMSKTKNLQKMLADAEEKKRRLQELQQGSEQDKEKAQNMVWGDTIKEAAGERVKEDPNKLKKALKRREAKKKKSAKAWKSRMEHTKEKMDERQKIRSHNLNKRKIGGAAGANLSKTRIEEDSDKTKSRPGFEGRKQGFLNNKHDQ